MSNYFQKFIKLLYEKFVAKEKSNDIEVFRKPIITDMEIQENFDPQSQYEEISEIIVNELESQEISSLKIEKESNKKASALEKAQQHIKNSYLYNKDLENQTKQTVQDVTNVYTNDSFDELNINQSLFVSSDSLLVNQWDINPLNSLTAQSALSSLVNKKPNSKSSANNLDKIAKPNTNKVDTPQVKSSHPYRNLNQDALEKIANDPQTPVTTLEWLVNNSTSTIKVCVAKNPNCPINLLHVLCKDEDPLVRLAIAERVNNIPQILEELLHDHNYLVAWQARESLEKINTPPKSPLPSLLRNTYPSNLNGENNSVTFGQSNEFSIPKSYKSLTENDISKLIFVASNKNSSQKELMELTNYPYRQIHLALSRNENIPISTFWFLAKLGDLQIKRFLLSNPGCPMEIVKFLKNDEDVIISKQASNLLTNVFGHKN